MNAQSCLTGEKLTPADLESLLDVLPEGVVLLAPDGSVLFINAKGCEILGIDRRAAVRLSWEDLRAARLSWDLKALPARAEDLSHIDHLDVAQQGEQSDADRLTCSVKPIRAPNGQVRIIALLLTPMQPVSSGGIRQQHPENRSAGGSGAEAEPSCPSAQGISPPMSPPEQRDLICRTLEATGWNVAKAARRLKLSRTTLYSRIARYGLVRPKE